MPTANIVDETFTNETATLRILGRMVGAGAAAGIVLSFVAALVLGGGSAEAVIGSVSVAAMAGVVIGAVTNLANAALALSAMRRWPIATVRWIVAPVPVIAAITAVGILTSDLGVPALLAGFGAIVISVAVSPWCLAPARPS